MSQFIIFDENTPITDNVTTPATIKPIAFDLSTPKGLCTIDLVTPTPNNSSVIPSILDQSITESSFEESNSGLGTPIAKSPEQREESSAERRKREEEESERLAWQMMEEESMEAYRMQMDYIRQNASNINTEDFNLIEQIINDGHPQNEGAAEDNEDEEATGEQVNQSNVSDPDSWGYDRLLAIGNILGGT